MLLKLLRIRRQINEARRDPGGFAAEEVIEFALGFVVIPGIIALLALILFFILGFTTLLGGPMGFFKILFWIVLSISSIIFLVIRPIVRTVRRSTKQAVEKGIGKMKTPPSSE